MDIIYRIERYDVMLRSGRTKSFLNEKEAINFAIEHKNETPVFRKVERGNIIHGGVAVV